MALLFSQISHPQTSTTLPINQIKYTIDGDTFVINCVHQFKCVNGKLSIRALALDTPEMRGECQSETDRARAAKQFLVALKNKSTTITITPNAKRPYDRYNRLLASVKFDDIDWATAMIEASHGRVWNGSRGGWC